MYLRNSGLFGAILTRVLGISLDGLSRMRVGGTVEADKVESICLRNVGHGKRRSEHSGEKSGRFQVAVKGERRGTFIKEGKVSALVWKGNRLVRVILLLASSRLIRDSLRLF